jgi:hypothetical protein
MPQATVARPRVLHWIWNLSLGGDAKNLCTLAKAQSGWAEISIATRSPEPGIRAQELSGTGIGVRGGIDSRLAALRTAAECSPEIIIMHRNGRSDDTELSVLLGLNEAQIPCFEFNTFGCVDSSSDDLWYGHFFPSRSCLLQYAIRRGVSPFDLQFHAAPGYAVEIEPSITEEERASARREMGISATTFVVARLVRPDLRKWDPLPVLAVKELLKSGVNAHLIVQAAPPNRERWIRNLLGTATTLVEPSADSSRIRRTLAAADCLVNYSHIGETFGLAIAEAMCCALPVIVNSTPSMDNAQVELCDHGKTGLVASSLGALTSALSILADNPQYRRDLGNAGRAFIERTFAAPIVERRLRLSLIKWLADRGRTQASEIPAPATEDLGYEFSETWLQSTGVKVHQLSQRSAFKESLDNAYLRWLRLWDSLDYARSLGTGESMRAIQRRLKNPFLKRA